MAVTAATPASSKTPSMTSNPKIVPFLLLRFHRSANNTLMPHPTPPIPYSHRSEKAIERYFCTQIHRLGYLCIKQFNPYEAGWPDRLVVLPHGRVIWAEFKSTGQKPTELQQQRHAELRFHNHPVYTIATREEADALIRHILILIDEINSDYEIL